MVNQGIGNYYVKLLSNGSYPAPFSMNTLYGKKFPDSGFDLPENKDVAETIKKYSSAKYGRDLEVVNEDIRIRSQLDKKEEPVVVAQPFPPMSF